MQSRSMSNDPTPAAVLSASAVRRAIARRVADAHRTIGDDALLAFVSGSVVDDIADAKSDVDMSVIFHRLPAESALIAACRDAGGSEWFWRTGTLNGDGMVVAFRLDDIEVQIGYSDIDTLRAQVNTLLIDHNPDTPLHKLAEGIVKAEPLAGADQLTELQGQPCSVSAGACARHGRALSAAVDAVARHRPTRRSGRSAVVSRRNGERLLRDVRNPGRVEPTLFHPLSVQAHAAPRREPAAGTRRSRRTRRNAARSADAPRVRPALRTRGRSA